MKKTFLAMLLACSTMTLFAQTTPTTPTTPSGNQTEPTTSSPNTTQQATGVTGEQNTSTGNQMNNMNSTNASTPGSNINTWNGVQTNSTSWAPEKDPSWGWNNYGVWSGSANWNANPNNPNGNTTNNAGVNGTANMNSGNVNMSTDASMNSTGSYSAYGTAVPYLPANVQMRFNQDFPTNLNRTYSWNQYGDWFHTQQLNNGRSIQYFYDTRGNGYSLALPVLHTFVPENIVTSALNKYGSNLYSISMIKNNGGTDTYMIGLLDRGQISMHYLDESGVTVSDVWRTEEMVEDSTMQSTQSNAAMDGQHNMDNQNGNTNQNLNSQSTDGRVVNPGTVNNAADTQMPNQSEGTKMKDGKYKDKKKDNNHNQ